MQSSHGGFQKYYFKRLPETAAGNRLLKLFVKRRTNNHISFLMHPQTGSVHGKLCETSEVRNALKHFGNESL